MLSMVCLASNMDGMIADKLGYVYIVSDEKYNNIKYTKIQMTDKMLSKIDSVKKSGKAVKLYQKGKNGAKPKREKPARYM